MQVLTGYIGQNEIDLAAERGEVQGNNTGLSNLTAARADWVRDGKVRILLQYGNERLPVLKDVPTVAELTTSDVDREMLRFYAIKFTMTRPLIIPPDVPADRVAALQRAFADTMKDPQYLDECQAHRPRHQLARQRGHGAAGPPDHGNTAAGGRSAARPAHAHERKVTDSGGTCRRNGKSASASCGRPCA